VSPATDVEGLLRELAPGPMVTLNRITEALLSGPGRVPDPRPSEVLRPAEIRHKNGRLPGSGSRL
jgi:hypothetical protein